tara:strand:- start:124 stop:666 length:543 start_codon:yes stop_codon:yes gene_type:complete
MSGIQVRTQEHLMSKIRKKISPLIEDEKLMIKSKISDMAEAGYENLCKKIGADKIIKELEDMEMGLDNAQRKAKSFFGKTSRSSVAYRNSLNYEFRNEQKKISSEKCKAQCREWAEKYAERELSKSPIGKKIADLESLQEQATDTVMEATTTKDLTEELAKLLGGVGLQWHTFKALSNKK